MKNIFICLLFFLIYNVSFSQEKTEKNNLEKPSVFKFHPNPAVDEIFILGTNKIKHIELINVLGKRVAFYQFNKSIIKMDVSELKSGIYLIQVMDENNRQEVKRLVVK